MATCFDSIDSSSGLPKNRPNVSKFGIPECTTNFDTMDLLTSSNNQRDAA